MTAKQFEKKIKKMFRTQAKTATALGLTQQAISNFCTGRRKVPLFVIKLLQCLEQADKAEKEGRYFGNLL